MAHVFKPRHANKIIICCAPFSSFVFSPATSAASTGQIGVLERTLGVPLTSSTRLGRKDDALDDFDADMSTLQTRACGSWCLVPHTCAWVDTLWAQVACARMACISAARKISDGDGLYHQQIYCTTCSGGQRMAICGVWFYLLPSSLLLNNLFRYERSPFFSLCVFSCFRDRQSCSGTR